MEKEVTIPRKIRPVPAPKQSAFGTSLNFVPGTTKWAISLRNTGVRASDPYGKPALSVVLNHHKHGAEKAAKGLLSRIAQKYDAEKDDKVFATITAFKAHVPNPSLDDFKQLDEVLNRHVLRLSRKKRLKMKTANDSRTMPQLATASPPAMSPLRAKDSVSSSRIPRQDVRKDEWYNLSMLHDVEVQERDRRDRKNFEYHARLMRSDLNIQQQHLDDEGARKLQRDRDHAKQEKTEFLEWLEKERKRKEQLMVWQREENKRAEAARREVVEKEHQKAQTRRAEEKVEVKRVLESIQQDIRKQAEVQATHKRDSEETKLFNIREDERKKLQIAKELEKEKNAIKEYEEVLAKREQQRRAEEAERHAKMARMAAVAEQKHQEGLLEDAEVERRAAEVQKQWAKKRDEADAKIAAAKAAGLQEVLAHVVVQQRELRELDQQQKERSKVEAALAKQAHHQAVRDHEEQARRVRDANLAHRRDIEGQISAMQRYLQDGAAMERGMTTFERKYNAAALAKAQRLKAAGQLRLTGLGM